MKNHKIISFDSVSFIFGGIFFVLYLALFESSFYKFPNILLTIYFLLCLISFAFILDYYIKKVPQYSFVLRLFYVGLYILSPILIIFLIWRSRHEK
ncbi:hypothetical protein XK27_12535 [Streptococcus suis]|nr:hypothetical protein A7J10_08390 [Streptococcus suis]KPA62285.1 hypothetical protein XK27_12535 [Streptococcus suis]